MNLTRKILFVYSHWQTFVREDFYLLSADFKIKKIHFLLKKKPLSFFFFQLKGLLDLLFYIPKNDVVYIWFCDYHAFWSVLIAKIFRKKSVIQVGGFDAVSVPEVKYGLFYCNNFRTKLALWAYKNCDKIIAVDKSLIKGKNNYASKECITGIAYFSKDVEKKSTVIPTGYDAEKWYPLEKKNQVLTVAKILNERVFIYKGIDLYLEAAKLMPETTFIIIGLVDKSLIPQALNSLSNVKIYPVLEQKELVNFYAESKVYAQFSLSEGLPNVLCEAMLSGCIPVGSNVNGIPTAIGNTGFVLKKKEKNMAVALIKQALASPPEQGVKARLHIMKNFSKEKRIKALKKVILTL